MASIPPRRTVRSKDLCIDIHIPGNDEYIKISYPLKYGIFSRVETREVVLEFSLSHEIRHARSKRRTWLHPQEWLKRSPGNNWVYYSTGGYAGVFEALGEYYLPNLMYPTNSLLGGRPFEEPEISRLVGHWHDILLEVPAGGLPEDAARWLTAARARTPEKLAEKADALFRVLGSRISVMPPDARHTDYNFIPVHICDGCLYKCRFCKVKNKKAFTSRPRSQIIGQIRELKKIYGRDIQNHNALFLGEHDALNAPSGLILDIAETAYREFEFSRAYMKKPCLFMFGSLDALMAKSDDFFRNLDRLPFSTYINVGLESCDPATLEALGKPITARQVTGCFNRIQALNTRFPRIEITCNFVMDKTLSGAHYDSLMDLIRRAVPRPCPKGTVYLSPLAFGRPSRQVLYDFYKLKARSRFPTFLYLIQRY